MILKIPDLNTGKMNEKILKGCSKQRHDLKTFLVKGIRQKIACCVIPSMEYPRKGKTPVTESSSVVTSGWILGRI